MSDAETSRSRFTRFHTPRTRAPYPKAPDAEATATEATGFGEGEAPYAADPADGMPAAQRGGTEAPPSLLTRASAAKGRRRRRHHRLHMVLANASWMIVVLVPLAALVAEISLTSRCDLPLGVSDGRMRLVWHQIWLLSAVATVVPAVYLAWRAPERLMALSLLGSYAAWKGLALARDRVALPVCAEGWGAGAPRDPMDLPLTLATAGAFALFVYLAGLAALLRRGAQAEAD